MPCAIILAVFAAGKCRVVRRLLYPPAPFPQTTVMRLLALVAGFALGWSNMVHVADSENPANLVYYSVLAVGCVGAWLTRLEARGLARTLFAMAATLALIAVMLPSGAPPYLARNMAILHGVFVALFSASGLMFRHASLAGLK